MNARRLLSVLLLALGLAASLAVTPAFAQAEAPISGLHLLLIGDGPLLVAGRELDRATLTEFYQARDFNPIWVTAPEREAALVRALAEAPAHGLDAAAFTVPASAGDERELLLSDCFVRYASALARGRVSSAEIESDWAVAPPDFDAAAALDQAARGDVTELLAALAPAEASYKQLQAALAHYETLAAAGGWASVPDAAKLVPGNSGAAVVALRARLVAEGFLDATAPGKKFDAAVEAALKRFQTLHGVAVDGHAGPATFAALNVTAAERVEQIRANLERWRELPHDWPANRIEVNAPAAELRVIAHGEPVLNMRAIVGAVDHPTPVLQARMNAVLFNPPWNVPASITKKEILPHLRSDPHYLERNHYVYVDHVGYQSMQQLPGADNALGRIKFELPNLFDVYLHDTPAHPLFSRPIRTLSHGCVRLEEPRDLALYVLAGKPGFETMTDIDDAIALGDTRRVLLAHSVPVYVLYWTAFVDADGGIEFRDDIYGRDLRLGAAMAARDARERPATDAAAPAVAHAPAKTVAE